MNATVTTDTLAVPGARLHHEVRGEGPLVVLLGTPMNADSFAPLAEALATDHTVLTTDARGTSRSSVEDPDDTPSIETRADDIARLITHVGAPGPVTVFGSSGGAVTVLALAQQRPELVDTVVAHEPPLIDLLPDRDTHHAGNDEVVRLWFAGDHLGSWRAFWRNAGLTMPEEVFQAIFGHMEPQFVADTDYQNAHLIGPTTHWHPDVAVLRDGTPRVVVGIGEQSAGQICDRTSRTLAADLGVEPTMFPGGHTGFAEDPVAFEPVLRAALPGDRS